MNQLQTTGIILSRTDYGEADRIITLLTPDYGKLRLMAKGVRRIKSKLAGGIELFSTSQLTFIKGRGEIGTLVSTRLIRHYGAIVSDIERVQLGYELIKLMNKSTEDEPEAAYFELLEQAFQALNDKAIDNELIRAWFAAQLLRQAGHTPNLTSEHNGRKLEAGQSYRFNVDEMAFTPDARAVITSSDIKFLRLLFSPNQPAVLQKIGGSEERLQVVAPLVQSMLRYYIVR